MPTRPSRRDRRRASDVMVDNPNETGNAHREIARHMEMPTPLDAAVGSDVNAPPPEYREVDIGPIPQGMEAGQIVAFEFMERHFEVAVPEGCAPGSTFRVSVASNLTGEMNSNFASENMGLDSDRPEPNCLVDLALEEDPMWSTDWTAEQRHVDDNHLLVDAEGCVEWSSDCCVEQRPDHIAFENCTECNPSREQQPEGVEVFGLSDMSTWFTSLQRRREQALRAGKIKFVRKIDREIDIELEKSRQQGPTGTQAAFCNGQVDEEPTELDGVWGKDWAGLAAGGGA